MNTNPYSKNKLKILPCFNIEEFRVNDEMIVVNGHLFARIRFYNVHHHFCKNQENKVLILSSQNIFIRFSYNPFAYH